MKKALLSLLLLLILCSCSASASFNQDAWLNEPEKRNSMVNSMLNQYELKGMTEAEIMDLLGQPAQKLEEPSHQYVYYLGRAGLGVDDSLLRVYFKGGQVERYEVTHD